MTTQPITKTIQEGSEYHLPWMYSHKPGQHFVVEHKRAGRIVRTDTWVLVSFRHHDGELAYRWSLCMAAVQAAIAKAEGPVNSGETPLPNHEGKA